MLNKPTNPGYCATVVKINKLVELPNCDNVQAAIIFSNSVIVGKDTNIGDLGLFFPAETQLMPEFLKNNNLYRDKTLNNNPEKAGYFEPNGRIKTMRFRGHKSEGLFLPINCLNYLPNEYWAEVIEGVDFDTIKDKKICCKYIPKIKNQASQGKSKSDKKIVKKFDRLVENQFRLHIDTLNLRRNAHKINPDDMISITNKIHGTSWVVGKVLTKKLSKINELGFKLANIQFIPTVLNWFKWLHAPLVKKMLGHDSGQTQYDVIYSSRMVVKNKYINTEQKNEGYYSYDLWGEIAEKLKHTLQEGITLYGEAVGQLPTGAWIQKGYHYGTRPNQYDIYVYRITYTNPRGKVIEFSWPQIKEYCNKYGLNHVQEFYYGKAKDYCPAIPIEQHWNENFLNKLEKDFMLDRMCPLNNGEVPEEGVVVRVDGLFECFPYKLKNFRFLEKETKDLDKGEVDLETEQSIVEEEPGTEETE